LTNITLAFIFDLDGTLVETEELKALSYARAAAELRGAGYRTGLATMSHTEQARRVLGILGLTDAFDAMATRDDVEHGKPDPEIDLLVARELGAKPEDCPVIEDSPAGVAAALAAGMDAIAVTTALTRQRFRETDLLDRCRVVDDPRRLPAVVRRRIEAHRHE
jgi:beta-phosphoglucomutase-like phosphatase (HAD superfamily)